MQHIMGISRQQLRFSSLEDTISPDNQVRFIDSFVEYIDLSKIGFAHLGTGKCEVRDIRQQTTVLSTFFLNTSSSWFLTSVVHLPKRRDGILAVAKTSFPAKAKLWVRARVPNPEVSGEKNTQKTKLKLLQKKEDTKSS